MVPGQSALKSQRAFVAPYEAAQNLMPRRAILCDARNRQAFAPGDNDHLLREDHERGLSRTAALGRIEI